MPEGLPCKADASDLGMVPTGQNNPWTGPREMWFPKSTVYNDNKKAVLMTNGLKIKNSIENEHL